MQMLWGRSCLFFLLEWRMSIGKWWMKEFYRFNNLLNIISIRQRRTTIRHSSFVNIHSFHMLFSHSRLLGHTAVTVVQAALPWQEHSCSESFWNRPKQKSLIGIDVLQSSINSEIKRPITGARPNPCPLNPVANTKPGTSDVNPSTGMASDIWAIRPDHILITFRSLRIGKKSMTIWEIAGPM